MARLGNSYRQSQCLRVAVELRLPELLTPGPKSSAELATLTSAHEDSLRRLLRALAAMQVLVEEPSDHFALTSLGEQLRSDRLGPAVDLFNSPLYWKVWQSLDHSVRTGGRAFDHVHGMRDWDYYASHPQDGRRFDAAMSANTGPVTKAVVAAYDFSRYRHIADIGGGEGTLLCELLRAYPDIQATLFDRADVVERAQKRLRDEGLADRVEFVGGSFFDSMPTGADAYVMKSIIHDWSDEEAIRILSCCRTAVDPGVHLILIERVLPERATPDGLEIFMMDLNMLVNTGGRERTETEYRELLGAARFRLQTVVTTDVQVAVLEAVAS